MGRKKSLNLILPIYYGLKKKYMIGMNWYSTSHYRTTNKVKKDYHTRVGKILLDMGKKDYKLNSPIRTHYKVYYKNPISDASNIVAVIEKFLLDALQEHGVIEEDNVQHHLQGSWEVMEQDKDNPRVEVEIKEI